MSNPIPGFRPSPLSVRFTENEKARLRELAGDMPLGTYIRAQALGNDAAPRTRLAKAPVRDGNALGQVLALLGQSRIGNNLNQLAKAINLGALPVNKETEADIRLACAYVGELRRLLLTALGVSVIEEVRLSRLADAFTKASQAERP